MADKELSYAAIGAAMRVHAHFGSGYLEEVYKNALMVELKSCGIKAEKEVPIVVEYHGVRVGNYQADIIVEKALILELKAVSTLVARHEAQLVNYLTATGVDEGLLINFGAPSLQFKHKYRIYTATANKSVARKNVGDIQTGFTGLSGGILNPVNPVNSVERNEGIK